MINDATIDFAGFVVHEPSFTRLANGASKVTLRVAYTERRFNRETGDWGDGPTSFVNVLCWRTLADNVAMCLRKGEPVVVRGRMRIREYEDKDGSPRSITEVEASQVGHDLSRGVAHFSRTRRAAGETAAESAEALEPGLRSDPAGERAAGNGAAGENGAGGIGVETNGVGESGAAAGGVLDDEAVAELAGQMIESVGDAPD